MTLNDLFVERRAAIAKRWLDLTLETYPPDTSAFLSRVKDQFANPVGQTLSNGVQAIWDGLLGEAGADELCAPLRDIIKIRSVQEFTPARAVSFVFLLKRAIREELGPELRDPERQTELWAFERRIDQVALYAFDIYTQCRDQVSQLRINEIKRRVSGLLRRTGWTLDDPD